MKAITRVGGIQMKRIIITLIICVVLLSFTQIFASDSLYAGGTVANETVEGETRKYLETPGITNEYVFSGHVKIIEIGSNPWNGIRFITGANDANEISALLLTKEWGVRVEFKGDNMSDFFSNAAHYGAGDEFDFSITKEGASLKLYIGDTLTTEVTIPDGKDAFTDGYSKNVGFVSSECKYEVSNIVVSNLNVEPETNPSTADHTIVLAYITALAITVVLIKKQKAIS